MHTLKCLFTLATLTLFAASVRAETPDHPAAPPPPPAIVTAALPTATVIQVDGQSIVVSLKGGKTVTLAPPIEMRAAVGKSPVVGFRSSQLPDPKKCQAPDWQVPAVLDTFANCSGSPIEALKCQSGFTAKRAALCLAREGYRPLDQNGNPLWVYVPARQKDNGGIFHYTAEEVARVTDTDTDHDGVLNRLDKCPEVVGPVENNGCPYSDEDKDGLLDKDDKCPMVAGPIANNGCPYSDRDKDGIVDEKDACPEVAGVPSDDPKLNGCPVKVATPAPAPAPEVHAAPAKPVSGPKLNKLFVPVGVGLGSILSSTSTQYAKGALDTVLVFGFRLQLESLKNWQPMLQVGIGSHVDFLPRGTADKGFIFTGSLDFIRGMGSRVYVGPGIWYGLTQANLEDQSYLATNGGGVELRILATLGAVGFSLVGGPGIGQTSQPGRIAALNKGPIDAIGRVLFNIDIQIPVKSW